MSGALYSAILRLARELPPATLDAIASELESTGQKPTDARLARFGTTGAARELLRALVESMGVSPGTDPRSVALALRSGAFAAAAVDAERGIDIAWTGPGTQAVPMRRVDQAMYELIESAERELIVSSFVAWGAETALGALRKATERGVRVSFVAEMAAESGGAIAFDGLAQVRVAVPAATIYYWPLERRGADAEGKKGILHAKCLVCDERSALVSSANFTTKALEWNMELGLLVRGGDVPGRLARHFRQLVHQGELMPFA